jgi:hypothetical protein
MTVALERAPNLGALALGALVMCGSGCLQPAAAPTFDQCEAPPSSLRPQANPIEYVSLSLEWPIDDAAFEAFAGRLFGEQAAAGDRHEGTELNPGLTLTVLEDERTADQLIATLAITPAEGFNDATAPRVITQVPVGFQVGGVWIDAVRAALARTQVLRDEGDETFSPWNLDYKVRSAQGGLLHLSVFIDEQGQTFMRLSNETPRTSLNPGEVNLPAQEGQPFETVSGTVWFTLGRDEFDFFSRRAYGIGQGAEQNFRDFQLLPHAWLRLTVTPQYALEMVDVGFEIITVDGRRVQVAKAPASYVAGEQFQQNVLRMVDNMNAQEAAQPGSSLSFTAPFHYEDPEGGGVVKVIAQGRQGVFRIAYFVESPATFLEDTDFVPLQGTIDIPEGAGEPGQTCPEDQRADEGRFIITFAASSTVAGSPNLKAPLDGTVYGSIFRSEDVTLLGPNDGAEALVDFRFEGVDVTDPDVLRAYEVPTDLPAGDYQILGFIDIDDDAVEGDASPDPGDPVMIPIGGYPLACALQPVIVEFAILLPEDY